jgi:hypothetical protein
METWVLVVIIAEIVLLPVGIRFICFWLERKRKRDSQLEKEEKP